MDKYVWVLKPSGYQGGFKKTTAIKEHKCEICGNLIQQNTDYYCEQWPKWLPINVRDIAYDGMKMCNICAMENRNKRGGK